mgnify:CR=1 FL=1
MSIAESILGIVKEAVEREKGARKVEAIDLRIGKLRAVVPENLVFCFEIICRGTPFEGSRLRIEEIPVRVKCGECGSEGEKEEPIFICSACGSPRLELVSGKELEVRSIDVAE